MGFFQQGAQGCVWAYELYYCIFLFGELLEKIPHSVPKFAISDSKVTDAMIRKGNP